MVKSTVPLNAIKHPAVS